LKSVAGGGSSGFLDLWWWFARWRLVGGTAVGICGWSEFLPLVFVEKKATVTGFGWGRKRLWEWLSAWWGKVVAGLLWWSSWEDVVVFFVFCNCWRGLFSGRIVEGKGQWCLVWKKWETTDWLRFEEERLILELMKNWFWAAAVIIFGLVWFLFIKIIKLKFYKIKNKTETGSNRSVLILFGYFILKN
jgi:hypothetical protein